MNEGLFMLTVLLHCMIKHGESAWIHPTASPSNCVEFQKKMHEATMETCLKLCGSSEAPFTLTWQDRFTYAHQHVQEHGVHQQRQIRESTPQVFFLPPSRTRFNQKHPALSSKKRSWKS